jgi:hypothetical protein
LRNFPNAWKKLLDIFSVRQTEYNIRSARVLRCHRLQTLSDALFSITKLQRLPGGLVELEALAEPLPLANRGRAAGSRYWLGKERGGQDSLSHSGARSIRAAAA